LAVGPAARRPARRAVATEAVGKQDADVDVAVRQAPSACRRTEQIRDVDVVLVVEKPFQLGRDFFQPPASPPTCPIVPWIVSSAGGHSLGTSGRCPRNPLRPPR